MAYINCCPFALGDCADSFEMMERDRGWGENVLPGPYKRSWVIKLKSKQYAKCWVEDRQKRRNG